MYRQPDQEAQRTALALAWQRDVHELARLHGVEVVEVGDEVHVLGAAGHRDAFLEAVVMLARRY